MWAASFEASWVHATPFLLDPNPGRGGLLGSAERLVEFCWACLAAAVEPVVVEPVHP